MTSNIWKKSGLASFSFTQNKTEKTVFLRVLEVSPPLKRYDSNQDYGIRKRYKIISKTLKKNVLTVREIFTYLGKILCANEGFTLSINLLVLKKAHEHYYPLKYYCHSLLFPQTMHIGRL